MELAVKGIPFKLFKMQEDANTAEYRQPKLVGELKECVEAIKRNEAVFDNVLAPELIDASIYERQALLCKYEFLLRAIKMSKQ
ncbi:MAG: DUF2508 family protein [Oscillospiraceae bacterium]